MSPLEWFDKITEYSLAPVAAKLDSCNPSNSGKDRTGVSNIEAAERPGQIRPGKTVLIPPPSTTGSGLYMRSRKTLSGNSREPDLSIDQEWIGEGCRGHRLPGSLFPRCAANRYALSVTLSVVIITYNEEANIGRTLESVKRLVADDKGEVIVVDSGSTDRTVEIARSSGAKVFIEDWKGYAAQKNSALEKASGDWILSLDADESIDSELLADLLEQPSDSPDPRRGGARAPAGASGFWIARKNYFLGRWIQHGGFWPDRKLRFFRRGNARFEDRLVHEDVKLEGPTGLLSGALVHNCYPTLSGYIDHMNRYSSLGARMVLRNGSRRFNLIDIVLRPLATFVYHYFFRLGFLDGREGLLLHLYHAAYVSWKYAKAWELSRGKSP